MNKIAMVVLVVLTLQTSNAFGLTKLALLEKPPAQWLKEVGVDYFSFNDNGKERLYFQSSQIPGRALFISYNGRRELEICLDKKNRVIFFSREDTNKKIWIKADFDENWKCFTCKFVSKGKSNPLFNRSHQGQGQVERGDFYEQWVFPIDEEKVFIITFSYHPTGELKSAKYYLRPKASS